MYALSGHTWVFLLRRTVMHVFEFILIGIGLAMDAFAVSICKGLSMHKINKKYCLIIALFFGGFQALMPFIGWILGKQFETYIISFDHWITFGLLAFLGIRTIVDAMKNDSEAVELQEETKIDLKELFLLAIATSIDALAVGVTFAFLQVHILPASTIIGIVTFILCILGVFVGNIFGNKFEKKASIAGGIILILIGIKILVEHLGIF